VENNNITAAHLILDRYGYLGLSNKRAAEAGKWDFVKISLASYNHFEHKVCHLAARWNRDDVLRVLVQRVPRDNLSLLQRSLPLSEIDNIKKENTPYCPLQITALYGSIAAAKILLDHGIDFDARATYSAKFCVRCSPCPQTPLQLACGHSFLTDESRAGIEKAIRLFVSRGARVDFEKAHLSPLNLVMERDIFNSFQSLLEHGASMIPYIVDPIRGNPARNPISYLHKAAVKSDYRWAKLLLDRGADINLCCKYRSDQLYNTTPIMAACQSKNWKVARYLKDRGADLTYLSKQDRSPIESAPEV
jgi:ankyrin repeat protein